MPADFDRQSYWAARFAHEESFEWLTPSSTFFSLIEPHLARLDKASARVLHVGFGTSDFQNYLRTAGFTQVVNVDFEPVAVERGQQLELQAFGDVRMQYEVQDATKLDPTQLGGPFDLVVDKSTADAVSCGGEQPLLQMMRCTRHCLRHGGTWISLSYSSSRFDLASCESLFDVEVLAKIPTEKSKETDPDIFHWCYSLRPRQRLT